MKKYLLYLLFISTFSNSQQMPHITPPSPEASSLFKFNEIPVSLFTGVPNISIPIFKIEIKDFVLPITIDYHSRGIQVGEIGSRVGLGWSLNYGGLISRQARGLYDESNYGYLENQTSKSIFFNNPTTRQNVLNTYISHPEFDFLPDQFFYKGTNFGGKFVLDQNDGGVLIQKHEDVIINYEYENNKITSFIIKDKFGNTYYYGKSKDKSRFAADKDKVIKSIQAGEIQKYPVITNVNEDTFYNTWHLMEIETFSGSSIHFYYSNPEIVKYFSRNGDVLIQGSSQTNTILGYWENPTPTEYRTYMSEISSEQFKIEQIVFEGGSIDFVYNTTARLDLNNSKALKKVKLLNQDGVVIKEHWLNYEYTTSPNDMNTHEYLKNSEPQASKRMFLKTIQQVNSNSIDTLKLPSYVFEYNSAVLPNRHSNSQDLWGYYNGKNNGRFLKFLYSEVGSRSVDTVKSEAGLLKKIIYPEGGNTLFEYEHNKVLNVFPKRLVFLSPNPITEKFSWITHLDYDTNFSNGSYKKEFVVGENIVGVASYRVNFDNKIGCGYPANTYECKYLVSLKNLDSNSTFQLFLGQRNVTLYPGTYEIKVIPLDPYHNPIQEGHGFSVDIFWDEEIADKSLIYAAGKRIKKIINSNFNNQVISTKSYSYINPETNRTSGFLFGLPGFVSIGAYTYDIDIPVYEPYGCLPGKPLSTYQGNSVGYEYVTEYLGENGSDNGKVQNVFSMTPDTGLYFEFPYHIPTDNEWLRGVPLKTLFFKRVDSNYQLVKQIENEYLYADQDVEAFLNPIPIRLPLNENLTVPSLTYLKDKRSFRLPLIIFAPQLFPFDPDVILYKTYHLTGGTLDLKSTKVTDYFDDNTTVESLTTYTYDYDHHYNVSSSKITTSNNEELETKYYYAPNLQSNINDSLVSKNIVGIPLKTEVKKDGELLSTQETLYKNWGNNLMAPEIIKIAKGSLPSEERIKYKKIDAKSNPLEIEQVDGIHICYIWGYNQTQPIAKIENATYAQVEQYVANLQTLSNGNNEQNLINALNNLRTALPNAMVTTYTYKPLIGISTVTDPKGNKQTYHYDPFNRLEFVKDKDGNILSENQYHYRTQN